MKKVREYARITKGGGLLHRAVDLEAICRRLEEMAGALQEMVYETTHLSPRNDDGSHVCRITAEALARARRALNKAGEP